MAGAIFRVTRGDEEAGLRHGRFCPSDIGGDAGLESEKARREFLGGVAIAERSANLSSDFRSGFPGARKIIVIAGRQGGGRGLARRLSDSRLMDNRLADNWLANVGARGIAAQRRIDHRHARARPPPPAPPRHCLFNDVRCDAV
jgi:hypothetical protein